MKPAGILSFVLLCACTGTDVGNGVVDVDFAIYDSESTSQGLFSQAAPAGIRVTNAWVTVQQIRLRDASDCSGDEEFRLDGPFAVDMLDSGTPEALQDINVTLSDYCRFEFRWDFLDEKLSTNHPDELLGTSVLIQGFRSDKTPFIVRSQRADELRLDARETSFSIDETTSALFVSFDIQALFDNVNLDVAQIGTSGVIRIEEGDNENLLDIFDDNLVNAAKLFDDNDGDKELDPEERDNTDVLAE